VSRPEIRPFFRECVVSGRECREYGLKNASESLGNLLTCRLPINRHRLPAAVYENEEMAHLTSIQQSDEMLESNRMASLLLTRKPLVFLRGSAFPLFELLISTSKSRGWYIFHS
jgi:hypothetical protein